MVIHNFDQPLGEGFPLKFLFGGSLLRRWRRGQGGRFFAGFWYFGEFCSFRKLSPFVNLCLPMLGRFRRSQLVWFGDLRGHHCFPGAQSGGGLFYLKHFQAEENAQEICLGHFYVVLQLGRPG